MLKITGLSVSYGKKIVLKNININFAQGKVYGLLGLNGSGKTSLLNAAAGLVKPVSGSILFMDMPLKSPDISFFETVNYFYPLITGREYLKIFKWKNETLDIEKWNEVFELPLDALIETYSTGMKKKLALIGILSLDRIIIFMDEPFNGLDMETSLILQSIINDLKEKNKIIILTSHILDTLTHSCDEILHLENGIISKIYMKDEFNEIRKDILNSAISEKIDTASGLL